MSLEITDLEKRFGDVQAVKHLSLSAEDDDFLVLVGPSGSGKTTTLRMIAGLESVTSGEIHIGDQVVNDLNPADRDIAMVFQDYALYPHLTVRRNMSLALQVEGMSTDAINERVDDVAETLGIGDLTERKPSELSGGQQQRVALGRAIVRDPTVFLMDEPLSNLDAKLRMEMRKELVELHEQLETTFVYVTHDQTEAMTMGTKIAVLDGGELQQVGTPEELYDEPVNEFVAEFIGSPSMNMLDATPRDGRLDLGHFTYEIPSELAARIDRRTVDRLRLGIRPEDIVITEDAPFEGHVTVVEPVGADVIGYLDVDGYELTVQMERDGTLQETETVRFDFPADSVHLFGDGEALA
jgi:multiple sugar transport system ATP-binding protein